MSKQKSVIRSYVQTLIDTTLSQGVSLNQLLESLPISQEELDNPNFRLDMQAMTNLWLRAVELTGNPHLGLQLGEQVQLGSLHAFGPIAMNCPTLQVALDSMVQYARIVSDGGDLSYQLNRSVCHIRYTPNESNVLPITRYQVEGVISTLVHVARMIASREITPVAIHLSHPSPTTLTEYQRVFRCPVHFGEAANEIILDSSDLALPVKFADPSLLAYHESLAKKILSALSETDNLTGQVKQIIHEVGPGVCTPLITAQKLNQSLRSVQRKLKQESTSYQSLLDSYRKDQSEHLLTHSTWSIAKIAEHLGYLNLSSYHRAFQRWYNMTPAKFRILALKKS